MKKIKIIQAGILVLCLCLANMSYAQNEFYSNGATIKIMSNAGTPSMLCVDGDFHLNGGSFDNDGVLELRGDMVNEDATGSFSGTGKVTFAGTDQTQRIIANNGASFTGANAFYDLENANTHTTPLVDQMVDVEVKNQLTLAAGTRWRTGTTDVEDGETAANYIYLSSTDAGALSGASTTVGDATNFIEGRLRRNTTTNETYTFPVGYSATSGYGYNNQIAELSTEANHGIVEVSFTKDANGTFPIQYDCVVTDYPIECALEHGWWNIDEIGATTFSTFDLTLKAGNWNDGACNTPVDATIIKKSDGGAVSTYTLDGDDSCDMVTTTPASVSRTSFTGMSDFAIASVDVILQLPVELISLSANPIDNQFIKISWETASEENNEGFIVERSTDGFNFEGIGWVTGQGSTVEQQDYDFDDRDVKVGTNYYYRLNQVDFDGSTHLSEVVQAHIKGIDGEVKLFPNPQDSKGKVTLQYLSNANEQLNIRVNNSLGQMIYQSVIDVSEGTNEILLPNETWGAGAYYLTIWKGENEMKMVKLILY